jgi:hypothetical protein
MLRPDLISKVKIRMEELTPFDEGLVVSVDAKAVKPLEQYIEELLDEAARDLLLTAPLHILVATDLTATVTVTDGVGVMVLPDDYLRLAYLQMNDWKRPVIVPISESHPDYILQLNAHTRGGFTKPVVVERHDESKKILECYTVTNAEKKRAGYIKKVVAEQVQDDLAEVLCWLCAAKVFQVFEMGDQAVAAMGQVTAYYQGKDY